MEGGVSFLLPHLPGTCMAPLPDPLPVLPWHLRFRAHGSLCSPSNLPGMVLLQGLCTPPVPDPLPPPVHTVVTGYSVSTPFKVPG